MPVFSMQSPADQTAFRGAPRDGDAIRAAAANLEPGEGSDNLGSEPVAEVNSSVKGGKYDKLQLHMSRLLQDTRSFVDGELSPERAELSQYYNGEPFGNEVDGRSKVVSTDVRDVIKGMMPSLMKVLCAPEAVVEVQPRLGRERLAMQQTDYLNLIFFEDNEGYRNTHAVLKDGLLKRLGAFKCWWAEEDKTRGWTVSGLTEEEVLFLQDTPGMTVEITGQTPGANEQDPTTYSGKVVLSEHYGCINIESVPPEELWYNRSARSAEEAALLAHVVWKRKSDLIEEYGVDPDDLMSPDEVVTYTNAEALQRNPHMAGPQTLNEESEETEKAYYAECYVRWPLVQEVGTEEEGEESPEVEAEEPAPVVMHKVICVGPSFKVVSAEPCDRPFFLFVPDPEPHSISGLGEADSVKNTQKIKSAVIRAILDSANQAIRSRTWSVEGAVSLADLQNEEMGANIRVKAPNMVGEFAHTFIGQQLFPVLEYFDDKTERSTGQQKGAAGLDADSLQSSTETAVAAAITSSQQHLELIARLFAETCLKPMFRYMLKLCVEHQDRPRIVRLRGSYEEVNPRSWDTDLDFRVNVGLGTNSRDHKLAVLSALKEEMKAALQMPGVPGGLPALLWPSYMKVMNKIAQLQGYAEGECFPTEQQMQQVLQQAAQQPPPPDPALIEAQAAAQKVQNTHEEHIVGAHTKVAALDLKRQQVAAQDARERQKIAIQAAEASAKAQAESEKARINAASHILDHHAATLKKGATE